MQLVLLLPPLSVAQVMTASTSAVALLPALCRDPASTPSLFQRFPLEALEIAQPQSLLGLGVGSPERHATLRFLVGTGETSSFFA